MSPSASSTKVRWPNATAARPTGRARACRWRQAPASSPWDFHGADDFLKRPDRRVSPSRSASGLRTNPMTQHRRHGGLHVIGQQVVTSVDRGDGLAQKASDSSPPSDWRPASAPATRASAARADDVGERRRPRTLHAASTSAAGGRQQRRRSTGSIDRPRGRASNSPCRARDRMRRLLVGSWIGDADLQRESDRAAPRAADTCLRTRSDSAWRTR